MRPRNGGMTRGAVSHGLGHGLPIKSVNSLATAPTGLERAAPMQRSWLGTASHPQTNGGGGGLVAGSGRQSHILRRIT